jgi:hypothetical protein
MRSFAVLLWEVDALRVNISPRAGQTRSPREEGSGMRVKSPTQELLTRVCLLSSFLGLLKAKATHVYIGLDQLTQFQASNPQRPKQPSHMAWPSCCTQSEDLNARRNRISIKLTVYSVHQSLIPVSADHCTHSDALFRLRLFAGIQYTVQEEVVAWYHRHDLAAVAIQVPGRWHTGDICRGSYSPVCTACELGGTKTRSHPTQSPRVVIK